MNRRGHAGRVDGNQGRIVKALRDIGCVVVVTSQVGNGLPDLIVGYLGRTILLEVKDSSRPPSERKLTDAEQHFVNTWTGGAAVVVIDEASAVKAVRETAKGKQ